ncbi:hypothetical protein PMEGAPR54_52240 [Priestia megaterium]
MPKMLPFLFMSLGTYILIMFMDVFQGNYMFQSLYSIKQYLIIARGEDYFLVVLFIFLFLFLSIVTLLKKQ